MRVFLCTLIMGLLVYYEISFHAVLIILMGFGMVLAFFQDVAEVAKN